MILFATSSFNRGKRLMVAGGEINSDTYFKRHTQHPFVQQCSYINRDVYELLSTVYSSTCFNILMIEFKQFKRSVRDNALSRRCQLTLYIKTT